MYLLQQDPSLAGVAYFEAYFVKTLFACSLAFKGILQHSSETGTHNNVFHIARSGRNVA